jgi:F0F1-type ATP synthase delta subunit
VLAQNDRLGELPAIADTFDDIMAAVRGEVKATVTTAEVGQQTSAQMSYIPGAHHLP